MPKLSKPFSIVLPGDVYPTQFAAGDTVDGDVSEKAALAGCVEKRMPKTKAMKSPENK